MEWLAITRPTVQTLAKYIFSFFETLQNVSVYETVIQSQLSKLNSNPDHMEHKFMLCPL